MEIRSPALPASSVETIYSAYWPAPVQEPLQVIRIGDQNSDFLKYIAQAGLGPGAQVSVLERNQSAQSIHIQLAAATRTIALGWGAAEKIWVRTHPVSAAPATVAAP
jgi:Fe2+ transport system protein FeoA